MPDTDDAPSSENKEACDIITPSSGAIVGLFDSLPSSALSPPTASSASLNLDSAQQRAKEGSGFEVRADASACSSPSRRGRHTSANLNGGLDSKVATPAEPNDDEEETLQELEALFVQTSGEIAMRYSGLHGDFRQQVPSVNRRSKASRCVLGEHIN